MLHSTGNINHASGNNDVAVKKCTSKVALVGAANTLGVLILYLQYVHTLQLKRTITVASELCVERLRTNVTSVIIHSCSILLSIYRLIITYKTHNSTNFLKNSSQHLRQSRQEKMNMRALCYMCHIPEFFYSL